MSEKRPWATKSAAHRIGLVPCPGCNTAGLPAEQIAVACAWCWNEKIREHTRFVPVDKAIEWATAHGVDIHDIPTPAEMRGALAPTEPPTASPPTDPSPSEFAVELDVDPDSDR